MRGKKNGLRDLILSDDCLGALGEYLKTRRDSDPLVFPYATRTLFRWVVSVGKMCGVKLHPHMLRHTLAMRVLDKTGNIRMTAQFLGHKDIRHTIRYTVYSREAMRTVLNERRKAS